jgi:glycosyltransferase involved in cell wall biosynthesis
VRILLVTPYHAPAYAFGGPVTVAETMVTDLVAAGHDVTVATTDALDESRRIPPDAPPVPPGARVLRFRNVLHRPAARGMAWNPRGYRRWVRAHVGEFDLVLLHDVYSVLSVAAARAAARAGVPFVVQPMGSVAPSRERGKPLVKRVFLARWGRRTLRTAAALVHCSEAERLDMLAAGAPAERLEGIGLPLDLPPADGSPRAAAPTLTFVGRLDPIKGVDRLLQATAIARREIPELRLELIGPGDGHRRSLEALAGQLGLGDAAVFRGFVPSEEKIAALRRAHASCLLSRSEGLPLAALEAMACATPVVLSRGCHLGEVDGRGGVVVSGEPEDTAAAIVALLRDDERRSRLSEGAREFAAQYERATVMGRMTALFERLAARP